MTEDGRAPEPAGPAADRPGTRAVARPTTFGLAMLLVLVAAAALRPPTADPSVTGLVWAGLLGALVLGIVWPLVTVRTVGLRIVESPTDLVVDQLGSLEVELTGRASGLSIGCTDSEAVVIDVVSPGAARLPLAIDRRGAYGRVRVDVGSDAPFGIVWANRTRVVELPRQLLVGPVSDPVEVPPGDFPGDEQDPLPSARSGTGEVVRAVRPYAPGDPQHLVHWPSTARTGSLVVRELEPRADLGVAITVDLTPHGDTGPGPDATGADPAVEAAASRAAGAVELALRRGVRVMLCTAEQGAPVTEEVADLLGARRRLALAGPGTPGTPPEGLDGAPDVHAVARRARAVTVGADVSGAAPDRATISSQRLWLLTALVGAQLWAALSSLPTDSGGGNRAAGAAALCAVLAMFGLRSIPVRWIVRGQAILSGMLLARFGGLGALDGLGGSWKILLWLAATGAALALSPSSRAVPGRTPGVVVRADDLPSATGAAPGAGDRSGASRMASVPVALLVASIALVGSTALLLGPRVSTMFPQGSSVGELVDLGDQRGDNALVARDQLDMTTRPRLTDTVVMSVRSPIASFWRAETFDEWDGSTWTRNPEDRGGELIDGDIEPSPEDIAALDGVDSEQEFRIETGFATAVPTAPSAVGIDSAQQLGQRPDGTLVAAVRPLGKGSTYTVQSRQIPATPELLRSAEPERVPGGVLEEFASPPLASQRTVELARSITEGLDNDYDKVRAIEEWMDENTEYSLDAPLSPRGVDVVDHFLFDTRLGWCEQIASSLVVMARSAGIPARLATGFTTGEWDPVGGRFVVREFNAHAWAEVWFPDVGWVTFDPTAQVPLAGTPEATPGAAAFDWREVGGLLLLVIGIGALAGGPLRRRIRRWLEHRRADRERRELVRTEWHVAEEERIEAIGREAGLEREQSETLSRYSGTLAEQLDDPELAGRGELVDRHRYSAQDPGRDAPEPAGHSR